MLEAGFVLALGKEMFYSSLKPHLKKQMKRSGHFFVVQVFLKFTIYKVELDGEILSLEIIKAGALKKYEIKLSRANTYLPITSYSRLHNWNPAGENTLWGV